jgi:putative transposase
LPESKEAIGIDVGLKSFATLSNGEKIDNPKFFRRDEKDLKRANRKHSKSKLGSKERAKRRKVLNKIHERIKNRRSNFAHQQSHKIVNKYGVICVEDLSINRMVHNHCLAKSISDVAWGQFLEHVSYKAENAGRKFVNVNPAYTSQTCSKCGHRQKLTLSDRIFNCPCCGLVIDRDHNSSLNILALGLESLGIQPLKAVNGS